MLNGIALSYWLVGFTTIIPMGKSHTPLRVVHTYP